jgi:hypothetical protein
LEAEAFLALPPAPPAPQHSTFTEVTPVGAIQVWPAPAVNVVDCAEADCAHESTPKQIRRASKFAVNLLPATGIAISLFETVPFEKKR